MHLNRLESPNATEKIILQKCQQYSLAANMAQSTNQITGLVRNKQDSSEFLPSVSSRSLDFIRRIAKANETKKISELGIREEFLRLALQWKQETKGRSSLGDIFTNDSYQRIIGMGREALPMILDDLRSAPGHWFYALEKIVGYDVAMEAKTFSTARAAWLRWGSQNA